MTERRVRSWGTGRAFGIVSDRERRDADLFWAELMGEPVRWTSRFFRADRRNVARIARARAPVEAFERVQEEDFGAFEEMPVEQAGAAPSASPCDISKTSETLDQFAHNSSAVTSAHRAILGTIADCVIAIRGGARPIREIRIVGHTDPSGAPAYNVGLGRRRAEVVRAALVAELNARAAGSAAAIAFSIDSRGEAEQIPGGAARNRRVEVSVPLSVADFAVHATDTDTHEIASVLGAAGLEHFVCVKGTGDIVLAAQISPDVAGDASRRIVWEATGTAVTSPAVGTDAKTARLSSAASGKFPVTLKLDGAVARQAVVWVVWSTIRVTAERAVTSRPGTIVNTDGTSGTGFVITAGVDHTVTIEPVTIITDADRPALQGRRTAGVPGAAQTHVINGNTLAGGAGSPIASSSKWDVSRQIRVKILNPNSYPTAQLPRVAGHLWNGQPASTIPENYPATDTIGNDDTHSTDERNDPYATGGTVTSRDNPKMVLRNSTGSDGDTFEARFQFREFLRLNLQEKWYRASDFSPWRFHATFRRASRAWTNNGSRLARDNAGF